MKNIYLIGKLKAKNRQKRRTKQGKKNWTDRLNKILLMKT
jgi:hypothetical protein